MNTKTKTDLRERIAVRAYFAWLNGSTAGHEGDWHAAERFERDRDDAWRGLASLRAKKAAATRKANAAAKAPIATVVAAQKPAARRATAH